MSTHNLLHIGSRRFNDRSYLCSPHSSHSLHSPLMQGSHPSLSVIKIQKPLLPFMRSSGIGVVFSGAASSSIVNYRPQRSSMAKVMFLHLALSFCSQGEGLPQYNTWDLPPEQITPWKLVHVVPPSRPPAREADSGIRSIERPVRILLE